MGQWSPPLDVSSGWAGFLPESWGETGPTGHRWMFLQVDPHPGRVMLFQHKTDVFLWETMLFFLVDEIGRCKGSPGVRVGLDKVGCFRQLDPPPAMERTGGAS